MALYIIIIYSLELRSVPSCTVVFLLVAVENHSLGLIFLLYRAGNFCAGNYFFNIGNFKAVPQSHTYLIE
jgi:hypothetical protein